MVFLLLMEKDQGKKSRRQRLITSFLKECFVIHACLGDPVDLSVLLLKYWIRPRLDGRHQ